MRVPQDPYPHRCPGPLGLLRLHLEVPRGEAAHGGVWWPYSRDLTREAPHLVDGFPPAAGRIERLVYAPQDWKSQVASVFTSHGRVKVGYFPPGTSRGHVLLRVGDRDVLRLQVLWDSMVPVAPGRSH